MKSDSMIQMGNESVSISQQEAHTTSSLYTETYHSQEFQQLLKVKRNFIIPSTIMFIMIIFTLPILTAYSHVLNHVAVGSITWAWVFAFCQFIMTWTLSMLYYKKSNTFDQLSQKIKTQMEGRDER